MEPDVDLIWFEDEQVPGRKIREEWGSVHFARYHIPILGFE
jgi:hypothetical protein